MKNILLVEDDPFLVDIYSTKFKKEGFNVDTASNGAECIKKLEGSEFPDLVILDIVLPNMDGWETLKRIKADPRTKDVKVVIMSNLGQKSEVDKGFELGALEYFIKAHYQPSEIVDKIKKILK